MEKITVGITGQPGFIGTHLFNYLNLQEEITLVEFKDEFFSDPDVMDNFVKKCDVIVHLAAVNRHNDPQVLYNTNIELVNKLIDSLNRTNSRAHIIISSSIQEKKDNIYGKSKRESRRLLLKWTKNHGGKFTGLIIPNVFGPFGKPYYNSFIATFSYKIINNEQPEILVDAPIDLIYINDLVKLIYKIIVEKIYDEEYLVPHIATAKVSEILNKLNYFHTKYVKNSIIPELNTHFDISLFNTFRSYLPFDYFPKNYTLHTDERGNFVELTKTLGKGQFSFSTTKPGITRGNHFHIRKVERFMIIKGKAKINLRKIGTNKVVSYRIDADKQPAFVDIPIWFTHNIENIGNSELLTLFWINEFYNQDNPDTYYEKVK